MTWVVPRGDLSVEMGALNEGAQVRKWSLDPVRQNIQKNIRIGYFLYEFLRMYFIGQAVIHLSFFIRKHSFE